MTLPLTAVAAGPGEGDPDRWVPASRTRNFVEGDPLLDWLDRYGRAAGFVPDDELEGYDPRTDMRLFVLERGIAFEDAVIGLIRQRASTERIAGSPGDARDAAKFQATVAAMVRGVEVIEQAVLWHHTDETFGVADLLVRADVLDRIVPTTVDTELAHVSSPTLGTRWHYRAVDVKFHTLDLLADGRAGGGVLAYAIQVSIYTEALRKLQGGVPDAGYLLGRGWAQGRQRGDGCLDRLARVEPLRVDRDGRTLSDQAAEAVAWVRRVRSEGAGWRVLPDPTVEELYPHARGGQDGRWHNAKAQIAAELGELTLLPGMNPERRRVAHAAGLRSWRDPAVSAASLGVPSRYADKCDAVLEVNRDARLVVVPDRIRHAGEAWRTPAPLELYVDFETVSNLADDFSRLPESGGQPLIFQIGCGRWEAGKWVFAQWTVDHLGEMNEAVIIGQWVDYIAVLLAERGISWTDARIIHWSAAERVNLDSAYNAARQRHPENDWPALPWFDFLEIVVRTEPVAVRGAFGFGLKAIAGGMHAAGLIPTSWGPGTTDGLGAMLGAWWCDAEARREGLGMADLELVRDVAAYNEVDCRVMAEIVGWLRVNR